MSIFSVVGVPQLGTAAETLAAHIGRVSDGTVLARGRLGVEARSKLVSETWAVQSTPTERGYSVH